jgi:hypothetical protein
MKKMIDAEDKVFKAVPETWVRVERDDGSIVGLRRFMENGEWMIECELWSDIERLQDFLRNIL